MNYLSHLYLSGDDEALAVGNFIADAVKGRMIERYAGGILEGIRLHRRIDHFTDTHPIVKDCRVRLNERFRKYSGVVTDIFFDHFLAFNWKDYSDMDLGEFAHEKYDLLYRYLDVMPARSVRILHYMSQGRWLTAYAGLDGIQKSFEGMARRARFESGMETAAEFLRSDYDYYLGAFRAFFPELAFFAGSCIENPAILPRVSRP